MSFHLAFLPYYILLVLVGLATFVGPLRTALSAARISIQFPSTTTSLGWITDRAQAALPVFGHPGALILYATVLSAVLFTRLGHRISLRILWRNTVRQGVPTSITILALVGVAMLMVYGGMTYLLAAGLARTGRIFPFLSPFIGVLGAVITGSNTNSNVLFGALQRDAAVLLHLNPVLIGALQTMGGALGSMITPAKVVLATATTGLAGQEGLVMRVTGRYLLVMTALLGVLGLGCSLL
jgi:lactate permease